MQDKQVIYLKKAIKTSEKVEKNATILAKENIKTSQKIMQATKEFTRKAVQSTKSIVKATKKSIKAIIESSKVLINLIIAGGWISVIVVLVFVIFGGAIAFIKVGTKSSTGDNSQINYEITSPILSVAKSQLGQKGGQPYWSWYGFNERVAWCACFVSWCANQCGLIENGQIPRYSVCDNGIAYFKEKNRWQDRENWLFTNTGRCHLFLIGLKKMKMETYFKMKSQIILELLSIMILQQIRFIRLRAILVMSAKKEVIM